MALSQKYRINALAKDLDGKSKDIIDALEKYGFPGRTHMAVLSPEELDVIFDWVTQAHPVEDINIYTTRPAGMPEPPKPVPKEKPVEPPKPVVVEPAAKGPEPPKPQPPKPAPRPQPGQPAQQQRPAGQQPQGQRPQGQPQQQQQRPASQQQNQQRQPGQPTQSQRQFGQPQGQRQPGQAQNQRQPVPGRLPNANTNKPQQQGNKPAAPAAPAHKLTDSAHGGGFQKREKQRPQQPQPSRERETRVIDTKGGEVNLSKYDEKLETLLNDTARKLNNAASNKEKFKKAGTDRKVQSERDRLALEKLHKAQMLERQKKQQLKLVLPAEIIVNDLAAKLMVTNAQVIKKLFSLGVMANVNQQLDYDTAALVALEFGAKVEKEVIVTIEDQLFDESVDTSDQLEPRAPVVVVMGHVDHGKTSLLDAIRHTHVTEGEAGGITQHIGAYRVRAADRDITFLDTPGHEAFTAMRARGAQVTDIAILVVAADDGIMPQTVEAINHAKAAGVSIIVAINKMDKPAADPETIKQELTKYELVPEEWGGDIIVVPVSAVTGLGIATLLEMVSLTADMRELKANPNRRAKGIVIEAKLDRNRGPVATVLIQNGTLHAGDIVIAGTAVGHVRVMSSDRGERVETAGPSVPVEIVGLAEVPEAGDSFSVVENERMARDLAESRRFKAKEEQFVASSKVTLDDLFAKIKQGVKELSIILKADVQGSVEAVRAALEKLSNEEVRLVVIHDGVGGVTESDVMLASASDAIIIGFNVRPDKNALDSAERHGVDIRTYRIIYECIEEVQAAMKGLLAPIYKEVVTGHAQVRQTIKVPNVGTVAGSYVQDGKVTRASKIRVLRDGVVIFEDKIASLRRFKDDVREVTQGFECGIGLEKFNDIKEQDILEAYVMEEIAR